MDTLLLSNDVKKAKARYVAITREIAENKNLPELLKELDEAITMVDESIVNAILKERPHAGLDALRNELWYLKFQILERD
jgi:hypothetical protein